MFKLDKLKLNNISNTIASMKLGRCNFSQINLTKFIKDLETEIGKKLIHDTLIMEAFVDIKNGDHIVHGKNTIVDQGLVGIINFISGYTIPTTSIGSANWTTSSPSSTYMVIGSNTGTGTSNGTTTLATPIGTAPGTLASSQSGNTYHPSTGVWQVQWTATWNAGRVPAVTLGEVGLYLYIQPALQIFGGSFNGTTSLFSRMASADGKFNAFTINNAVPLSIAWTFQLTYAT